MNLHLAAIKKDFPALLQSPVHYLDSACMSLKPTQVLQKEREYYEQYPACAGRSSHRWGEHATHAVADARSLVRKFIDAKRDEEIVFTKNTTESINLLAHSLPWKKRDVVLISDKEHNSNLLPWQLLAQKGVQLKVVRSSQDNIFDEEALAETLEESKGRVALAAFGMTANVDGVTIPARSIIKACHDAHVPVFLDAAQAVPHQEVRVRKLDVDYLAFSGHKMLGPTGTGVLYGKAELLEELEPFIIGGETVSDSTFESFIPEKLPHRLEGGLQHYAGIIGLGAACTYLSRVGMDDIARHGKILNMQLTQALKDPLDEGKIELIGPRDAAERGSIFNCMIKGMDAHNAAIMLDKSRKVMVRSGMNCVHSWYHARKKPVSLRASWYLYNDQEDIDAFSDGVQEILKMVR